MPLLSALNPQATHSSPFSAHGMPAARSQRTDRQFSNPLAGLPSTSRMADPLHFPSSNELLSWIGSSEALSAGGSPDSVESAQAPQPEARKGRKQKDPALAKERRAATLRKCRQKQVCDLVHVC